MPDASNEHEHNIEDRHEVDSLKIVLHDTPVLQVGYSYQVLKSVDVKTGFLFVLRDLPAGV